MSTTLRRHVCRSPVDGQNATGDARKGLKNGHLLIYYPSPPERTS